MVYIWLVPYALVCVGAIVLDREMSGGQHLVRQMVCALGALGCLFLIWHSMNSAAVVNRTLALITYSCLLVALALIGSAVLLNRRHAQRAPEPNAGRLI
jgi:cell division protein FtsW (lipid II flippase)